MRALLWIFLCLSLALPLTTPVAAQDATQDTTPTAAAERSATGGAQTLEDILARQRGEKIQDDFRRNATGDPDSAAAISAQLGTLGGVSDAEVFRALRYGTADINASARGPVSHLIIQDSGMAWLQFREGPMTTYGGYLMLAMFGLLVLFYLIRGKIRIDGTKTGRTVERFNGIERFAHWLLAVSFILLGITGLITLLGRKFLIPLIGKDAFAPIAIAGKWVHNNISWAFMLALAMVIVLWIKHNIPNRTDIKWVMQAGGLFSKGLHPPAKKFNAGQKVIYWIVAVFGISISMSGLALLFPFELSFFAKTFQIANMTGLPEIIGYGRLPEELTPYQEMQLSQLWHGIVAFGFMTVIIAHIYLGSVGMEGAFDAMGSGQVEAQWAKEHHSLWYDEVKDKETGADKSGGQVPAE
ncbi:formate dehydrogenase subunit gamma [Thalassovita sp.]|uniref:formate dehydrogenase subunit gamma n=1 Tax=Thalassovita sp. TaxID=1979401 RepID=UPI002AAFC133|nr:formate dehydrogenase subunit gamma [Thalassovita sp.]